MNPPPTHDFGERSPAVYHFAGTGPWDPTPGSRNRPLVTPNSKALPLGPGTLELTFAQPLQPRPKFEKNV